MPNNTKNRGFKGLSYIRPLPVPLITLSMAEIDPEPNLKNFRGLPSKLRTLITPRLPYRGALRVPGCKGTSRVVSTGMTRT